MKKLIGAAASHEGLKRGNNEDAYFIHDGLGLFVVADGMGGAASGEVASRIVVETISDYVRRYGDQPLDAPDRFEFFDENLSPRANTLVQASLLANAAVYDSARENNMHSGMGSTLASVMLDGEAVLVLNVGDSRIFRFRDGALTRLTTDHRLADDPKFNQMVRAGSTMMQNMGNTLTRAMGIKEMVEPDLRIQPFREGDVYLLCSDGLTDMVDEEVVLKVLSLERTLNQKVDDLIELALAGGGKDNVTVVLTECVAKGKIKGFLDKLKGG